jgi:hypothetical protein
MALDKELFNGKTVSNVLEEIYNNSKKKDKQINALMESLNPLLKISGTLL